MIPQIPVNWPIWLIAFVVIMWAIHNYGKNVFIFIKPILTSGTVVSLQKQIEELKTENHDLTEVVEKLRTELNTMNVKYARMEGIITGFQTYLTEKGFKDFPNILNTTT